MGLDNGIVARGAHINKLPRFLNYPFEDVNEKGLKEIHVCYWRKWWPFRNIVVRELSGTAGKEAYEFELTKKDLIWIRKLMKEYMLHPDKGTGGYWEKATGRRTAKMWWINLFWIIKWWHLYPDTRFYFYDSY